MANVSRRGLLGGGVGTFVAISATHGLESASAASLVRQVTCNDVTIPGSPANCICAADLGRDGRGRNVYTVTLCRGSGSGAEIYDQAALVTQGDQFKGIYSYSNRRWLQGEPIGPRGIFGGSNPIPGELGRINVRQFGFLNYVTNAGVRRQRLQVVDPDGRSYFVDIEPLRLTGRMQDQVDAFIDQTLTLNELHAQLVATQNMFGVTGASGILAALAAFAAGGATGALAGGLLAAGVAGGTLAIGNINLRLASLRTQQNRLIQTMEYIRIEMRMDANIMRYPIGQTAWQQAQTQALAQARFPLPTGSLP